MFRRKKPAFLIAIANGALESIFDDCDKFDVDETGGRLLGTYRQEGGRLEIQVKGVLEAGPKAERSPTYFMQDGEHQEKQFRAIEAKHPDIEHLGNWHTHHVNGYPTLSSGDHQTYFRTVNHENHNTDFFYALLVVKKNRGGNPRYEIKHFIFLRNEKTVYEVPPSNVRIVDTPVLRAPKLEANEARDRLSSTGEHSTANPERVKDQEFFAEFHPGLQALFSQRAGAPYWKGALTLVDGSSADVVAIENSDDGETSYSITASCKQPGVGDVVAEYKTKLFRSARHAVIDLERDLNRAIYSGKRGSK
jgi:hypothetical protein